MPAGGPAGAALTQSCQSCPRACGGSCRCRSESSPSVFSQRIPQSLPYSAVLTLFCTSTSLGHLSQNVGSWLETEEPGSRGIDPAPPTLAASIRSRARTTPSPTRKGSACPSAKPTGRSRVIRRDWPGASTHLRPSIRPRPAVCVSARTMAAPENPLLASERASSMVEPRLRNEKSRKKGSCTGMVVWIRLAEFHKEDKHVYRNASPNALPSLEGSWQCGIIGEKHFDERGTSCAALSGIPVLEKHRRFCSRFETARISRL